MMWWHIPESMRNSVHSSPCTYSSLRNVDPPVLRIDFLCLILFLISSSYTWPLMAQCCLYRTYPTVFLRHIDVGALCVSHFPQYILSLFWPLPHFCCLSGASAVYHVFCCRYDLQFHCSSLTIEQKYFNPHPKLHFKCSALTVFNQHHWFFMLLKSNCYTQKSHIPFIWRERHGRI